MTDAHGSNGRSYDVIVVGLGAMGSASLHALARSGRRVLGIDQFAPPHALGSSHGRTRIIREAYYEHPGYVPLVRRAYDLWRELQRTVGKTLYTRTRGMTLGPEDGTVVRGVLASVDAFSIPHLVLSAAGVRRQFPGLQPSDDMVGVLDEHAGALFPEMCIGALLASATQTGAAVCRDEQVTGWEASDNGVRVRTSRGEYRAEQLVLAGGAWMRSLVPELAAVLSVERQPIHWFEPASHAEDFGPARCPVTLWEYGPGRVFYTLPDFGDGVKAGVHYEGQSVDPDRVDRATSRAEDAQAADLLRRFMPHAMGRLRESQVCLYTNAPDLHFIVDVHPAHPTQVVVLSACSGHGFKFATVIGEIAVELLATGTSQHDVSMFRMGRSNLSPSRSVDA
jgi:sarcosine oxidase